MAMLPAAGDRGWPEPTSRVGSIGVQQGKGGEPLVRQLHSFRAWHAGQNVLQQLLIHPCPCRCLLPKAQCHSPQHGAGCIREFLCPSVLRMQAEPGVPAARKVTAPAAALLTSCLCKHAPVFAWAGVQCLPENHAAHSSADVCVIADSSAMPGQTVHQIWVLMGRLRMHEPQTVRAGLSTPSLGACSKRGSDSNTAPACPCV